MVESEAHPEESGISAGQGSGFLDRLISFGHWVGALLGFAALAVLAVRAALRAEIRWDSWWYHIPFAAKRAGLDVPYEMTLRIKDWYDGMPPLPEFLEGLLWRVTGSVNATGLIDILALAIFLYYCQRRLKAPFSVVAVLSLTAPLVIIHAATDYIDLFGGALLAIGVTSLAAMILFDRWDDRGLFYWGLAGLVGAAWSKTVLVPEAFACLLCYLVVYTRRFRSRGSRRFLMFVAGAMLVASVPYVKNLIVYHNPVWPLRMPVWGDRFPFTWDGRSLHRDSVPPPLADHSQASLFLHSVLEIGHPTEYPTRERWTLDQGNAWIAYRSGGFWNVAVVTALMAAVLLGFLFQKRKGWALLGFLAAMWVFVAFQPESHYLRYYLFLPLTMAAIIGMLLPRVRHDYPAVTLVLLAVFLGEFGWMAKVNRPFYQVSPVNYQRAAEVWGMTKWWPLLQQGHTYCAVGFEPTGIFLTGPTMKEFHIVDRHALGECPPDAEIIVNPRPLQ